MSKRRHLITDKWENSPTMTDVHHRTSKSVSFDHQNRGSDLLHDYQTYVNKYKNKEDNLDSDRAVPQPSPLREFLTPKEAKIRSELMLNALAKFQTSMNAKYAELKKTCRNKIQSEELKAKLKLEVESFVNSIDSQVSARPPNPCLLCELSESARLARNCSNNSPLHNPELNILTQKFSNIFDSVGEYDSKYQFTCGANFHGIIKPILDFNVNNYLPSRAVVLYTTLEVKYFDQTKSKDFDERRKGGDSFFSIDLIQHTTSMNAWSEVESMMYSPEDSIMKNTDCM
jgi:hypothetical protein